MPTRVRGDRIRHHPLLGPLARDFLELYQSAFESTATEKEAAFSARWSKPVLVNLHLFKDDERLQGAINMEATDISISGDEPYGEMATCCYGTRWQSYTVNLQADVLVMKGEALPDIPAVIAGHTRVDSSSAAVRAKWDISVPAQLNLRTDEATFKMAGHPLGDWHCMESAHRLDLVSRGATGRKAGVEFLANTMKSTEPWKTMWALQGKTESDAHDVYRLPRPARHLQDTKLATLAKQSTDKSRVKGPPKAKGGAKAQAKAVALMKTTSVEVEVVDAEETALCSLPTASTTATVKASATPTATVVPTNMSMDSVVYVFKELVGLVTLFHSLDLYTRGRPEYAIPKLLVRRMDGERLTPIDFSERRYDYRSSNADEQTTVWNNVITTSSVAIWNSGGQMAARTTLLTVLVLLNKESARREIYSHLSSGTVMGLKLAALDTVQGRVAFIEEVGLAHPIPSHPHPHPIPTPIPSHPHPTPPQPKPIPPHPTTTPLHPVLSPPPTPRRTPPHHPIPSHPIPSFPIRCARAWRRAPSSAATSASLGRAASPTTYL